jgi:hypothetical protein
MGSTTAEAASSSSALFVRKFTSSRTVATVGGAAVPAAADGLPSAPTPAPAAEPPTPGTAAAACGESGRPKVAQKCAKALGIASRHP